MKLNAFTKSYDGRKVLDFSGIELPDGKICAVIGSNGSGKSTLTKVLSGIVKTDSGIAPLPQNLKVGYMPQKSFAFRMSTMANVRLAGDSEDMARQLMEKLQIAHLEKQKAKRLSGGEMARMALARLLTQNFDLLILDEPTASMDMESTALTEEVIAEYCRATGCTVLWVTHSLPQARRVAEHAIFMRKGLLWEIGSAQKLLYEPEKEETKKFLDFYGI